MTNPTLRFSVAGTKLSFRAELLPEENPEVVKLVLQQLPFSSVLGHVIVAGETFWMPTKILSLGGSNMVERQPGAVYHYAPGQTINICYGEVTETAKVNKFAQIYHDDLGKLETVGKLVYDKTVSSADKTILRIDVSLMDASPTRPIVKQPTATLPTDPNDWRVLKARIEEATNAISVEEPDEVRQVRLGYVASGAGTGGQFFSVLIHLKAYLMMDGADILYRLLKLKDERAMTSPQLKRITIEIMVKSFDHFQFLGDLGLHSVEAFGSRYKTALATVHNKEDFVELTGALLSYINHLHRWLHIVFPWHLGSQFPRRTLAEIADLPKLPTYSEEAVDA